MREDIIIFSKLVHELYESDEVIFMKGAAAFSFVKGEKGWCFGDAVFQTADLIRLIVQAKEQGFSVIAARRV